MDDLEFLRTSTPKFKRCKTPSILQMEMLECGAASLSMILRYHKKYMTLEELRVLLNVSSNGVDASSIINGARSLGLVGKGFKKSIPHLYEAKPPFIIFWNNNHFLVVEGFSKKGVYLNDPACGPRMCSFEDFCSSYSHVVLTFEEGPDFKKGGSVPGLFHALKRRMKGLFQPFLFLGINQLCILAPKFAMIAFTQIFIDEIFIAGHHDWKKYLLLSMIIFAFISSFLIWLRGKIIYFMNAKISVMLSSEFFFHILKLPLDFYLQRSSGDLAFRLNLNDRVINTITQQFARVALNMLVIGLFGTILFLYSPWLGLVSILEIGINSGLLYWVNRKRIDAASDALQKRLKMVGYGIGGIQNIETIKNLGIETSFSAQWGSMNSSWLNASQNYGKVNIVLGSISTFFDSICSTGFIGVGAYLVINGHITIGQLFALKMVSSQFTQPVKELVSLIKNLQQAKVDLLRLDDTLDNQLDSSFQKGEARKFSDQDFYKLRGNISFENVTFGSSKAEPPILEDFSLEIKPGQIKGLLDLYDSQRSIIGMLATGLYQPWSGKITFDGKEFKEIPTQVFKDSIGYVDQNMNFFSATIKDNLTFYNHEIEDETIYRAARDACIHDEILSRKNGYSYLMDQVCDDFCYGEKQRLEFARSLVNNPTFLIIDYALDGLETKIQKQILQNIRRRGCTCLIISKMPTVLSYCDEIAILEDKKIKQVIDFNALKVSSEHAEIFKDQE